MKGRLASFWILTFLFGCGLNTAGQGPDDDDQGPSDVPEQEAGPDITEDEVGETDTADDRLELAEDASLEASDEAGEADVEEATDETEDDGAEDGTSAEDGEDEDGEITDPCAPPEIPTVGLYLWYCIPDPPVTIDMSVMRWVDRPSETDIVWHFAPGCNRPSTRALFCSLTDYGAASVYYFNVVTPGIDPGWSCGPRLEVTHGVPRVFWNGIELDVGVADNASGGCNHTFAIPVLKSLLDFLTDYL